ncbi:ABC transporter ATP-binding protein [halophilic archaeon]|nr:ABC transporter ATP-binding protein [halophilic archaeon]
MIRFDSVSKVYDDQTVAVDDVSFEVPAGETVTIVGPSGCGKTTTMKMINGLVEPTEGTVYVDGTPLADVDTIEHRRNVGYVIQKIGLFSHMSVAGNVGIVPEISGWEQARIDDRVAELLELVQLPQSTADSYPDELSGGQRQRVGVARALAAEPDVLLMDEPFGALDPITREELQDEFLDIQSELDVSIAFVTHDIDEALKMGDRVAVMRAGELVQFDTPKELLANPANEFVAQFLGGDRLLKQLHAMTVDEVMGDPRAERSGADDAGLAPDTDLKTAMQMLLAADRDLVPVVENGDVVGSLSEQDIERAVDAADDALATEVAHG